MLSRLVEHARKCADVIASQRQVLVVSHIDADGLTSAAIICSALERVGIEMEVRFVKQLAETEFSEIADENPPFIIFTDLGSGMLESIRSLGIPTVVSDHHLPPAGYTDFAQDKGVYHLNPHLFGIDGSRELSGAGTTFFLAQGMGDNRNLADLSLVGAVGDLQHVKNGRLAGANRSILELAIHSNIVSCSTDVLFFGKQTRPIFKLLQYASDPYLPGLTGDEDACIAFLKNIGIPLQGERWRRWIDLEGAEKQKIVSKLIQHQLAHGVSTHRIQRMVGEVYTLLREREGTELRDAQEYSTLLNATARYGYAEIGLAVCMGERGDAFEEAQQLLSEHRQNLVDGLNFVREEGLCELEYLQYFDAGSRIRDTIVGIVAGMSYSLIANRDLPIIAFASTGQSDGIKVSARANQDLVRRGLNLAAALRASAEKIGGVGGGHDIAAGATIPASAKEEFLAYLNEEIGKQMNSK